MKKPPEAIMKLQVFLLARSLKFLSEKFSGAFGDRSIEYAADEIAVRCVSDRGIWFVEVADISKPDEWYDAALLRDLVDGVGEDVLSIDAQILVIESHYEAIRKAFDSDSRDETHRCLALLRDKRAKRRFPGLFKS